MGFRHNSLFNGATAICIALTPIFFPTVSYADSGNKEKNIVERIESESKGRIAISIPDNILEFILQPPSSNGQEVRPGMNKLAGYRIQVFSDGRNQSSLEARAKARGSAILARFPKYRGQVYTFSSSPNWYTRIGNFRTTGEANSALEELKLAFPNFASEMRIVKTPIVVIK